MKRITVPRAIKIYCVGVWLASFVLALSYGYYLVKNAEKEERLKAAYTAEISVNRIEAQLNKYLEISDFLKNIVESGYEIEGEDYAAWMQRMPNSSKVIKAMELAKDGVVNEIYPLEGNKDAMGIDMLTHPARRYEAQLAVKTGKYTIAGPYRLAQGGMGALLFDPIYTKTASGEKRFWGFSILVIDWDKFVEEIGLDKLSDASFAYTLWKENSSADMPMVIAHGRGAPPKDGVKVKCDVPNNTWYFEIAPEQGWVTDAQLAAAILAAFLLAGFVTIIYYQVALKRHKEKLYAEEIRRAATVAKMANEAKTRFLFNMSHDIRTPMNAIMGFTKLLSSNLQDEERCRDYLAKIQSSSNLLLTIINQVLEMARIESGKMVLNLGVMNIREVVNSLNTVFETEFNSKRLHYNYQIDVQHEIVLADQTKFEEIILNIVSNSIKYTESGGEINVTLTELEGSQQNKARYRLTLADTGIGMKPEYIPHMFEEFSREHTSTETKVIGTGLGLAIVKSLIELMQGTIQVESEYGVGTRFVIELEFPIAVVAKAEGAALDKLDLTKFKDKRILLAEDNALNAEIAEVLLTEVGFKIQHVENGEKCLEELQQRPEGYYAAILMDVQMPKMDGYTATKEIRKLQGARGQIPIIAMTANVYDEDRQKAYASGMNGFVTKPLNLRDMLKALDEKL